MSNTTRFRYVAMDPVTADTLVAAANHRRVRVKRTPGYPCRRCLQDAQVGESLVLVSHDPFPRQSPFAAPTAIYLHESCEPFMDDGTMPEMLRPRTLSVRAFDRDLLLRAAHVVDGGTLEATLTATFADPNVDSAFVHTAAEGCWHCVVRRAE